MEFCLCPAVVAWIRSSPGHPYLTPNGVDRVAALFLYGIRNSSRRGGKYADMPVGSITPHKFLHHTQTHADYKTLPVLTENDELYYMLEVFVDDFIKLAIPVAQSQLDHLASTTMAGVQDVFPPHPKSTLDPISEKKLIKGDGEWAPVKIYWV